jgi:hypothetical protein
MNLELPALMYKDKGEHQRAGGTYSYKLVSTPEEVDVALRNGWYKTLPGAIAGEVDVEGLPPEAIDENAPPTRAELEAKAKELGIAFHPKINDKKLQEKIEAEIEHTKG